MTLLEKAKSVKSLRSTPPTSKDPLMNEKIDLVWEFLTGGITGNQAAVAMGINTGSITSYVIPIIRQAIASGRLVMRNIHDKRG